MVKAHNYVKQWFPTFEKSQKQLDFVQKFSIVNGNLISDFSQHFLKNRFLVRYNYQFFVARFVIFYDIYNKKILVLENNFKNPLLSKINNFWMKIKILLKSNYGHDIFVYIFYKKIYLYKKYLTKAPDFCEKYGAMLT